MRTNGRTKERTVGRILRARMVNAALGGAVVGPGEVDELQEELVEACRAIAEAVEG